MPMVYADGMDKRAYAGGARVLITANFCSKDRSTVNMKYAMRGSLFSTMEAKDLPILLLSLGFGISAIDPDAARGLGIF